MISSPGTGTSSFAAFARSIKKWKCPEGTFVHNFSGHDAIINTMSVNEEGVMFSGGQSNSVYLVLAVTADLPIPHLLH